MLLPGKYRMQRGDEDDIQVTVVNLIVERVEARWEGRTDGYIGTPFITEYEFCETWIGWERWVPLDSSTG